VDKQADTTGMGADLEFHQHLDRIKAAVDGKHLGNDEESLRQGLAEKSQNVNALHAVIDHTDLDARHARVGDRQRVRHQCIVARQL